MKITMTKVLGISAVILFAQQASASSESPKFVNHAIAAHCTNFEEKCLRHCGRFGAPILRVDLMSKRRQQCLQDCVTQYNQCIDREMARFKEQVRLRQKWEKAQILAQTVLAEQEQMLPDNSSK